MLQPDANELHQIGRAQPDRKAALVERLLADIADAQAQDAQAMLLRVKRSDRLAEQLAHAIAGIGTRNGVDADALDARVEADRVVRRGEHDALDALPAGCLEQIVAADDVRLQDRFPRTFGRMAAEIDDALDPLAGALDLVELREIGANEGNACRQIGRWLEVADY